MPVIEPPRFDALDLVPFQINPHYTDAQPPGHAGETRADRIAEFVEVDREITVVGLRESSILRVEKGTIDLLGKKDMRVFRYGKDVRDVSPGGDLSFLLE